MEFQPRNDQKFKKRVNAGLPKMFPGFPKLFPKFCCNYGVDLMITSITEEGGKDLVILNKLLTNQEYECFTLINYVNEPQGVHRLNSMSIEL